MQKIKFNSYFFIILFISLSSFNGFENATINEIIQLGNKREIFVDHYLIDNLRGTRMKMHHPHDEGIVMYFDNPWEGQLSLYGTVVKDGDIFRLYYRGLPVSGRDGTTAETTCYAESKDGINWIKPDLHLFEVDGSYENNVILADAAPVTHNFSPFKDTNPNASPDQKFKALGGGQDLV